MWADRAGRRNPLNGSYDGAIGMIADGLADIYMRAMDMSTPSTVVDYSSVIGSLNFFSLQTINHKLANQDLVGLIIFLVPSFEFLTASLGCLLISLVFRHLFSSGLRIDFGQNRRRNLQTKVLAFFHLLFLLFALQLYNGSLNTSNLITDTSDLLYNDEQIRNTKRESCLFEESFGDLDNFRFASKGSLMHHIYLKRNKSEICYVLQNNGFGNIFKNVDQKFAIVNDQMAELEIKFLHAMGKKDSFINQNPIFQSLRTYIVRKNLRKDIKKYFDSMNNRFTSVGFLVKVILFELTFT